MSVQVSTRIDEATKQQFDKVCEAIGISPSNALGMFIRGVVTHNGIPFDPVISPEKPSPLAPSPLPFGRGCMKGKMWMADDFDAPLEDFREYMQ
jgi:addiction module RelB/DinJ family antitoxin